MTSTPNCTSYATHTERHGRAMSVCLPHCVRVTVCVCVGMCRVDPERAIQQFEWRATREPLKQWTSVCATFKCHRTGNRIQRLADSLSIFAYFHFEIRPFLTQSDMIPLTLRARVCVRCFTALREKINSSCVARFAAMRRLSAAATVDYFPLLESTFHELS